MNADATRLNAVILTVTGHRDPLVVDGEALAQRIAIARTPTTKLLDLDTGHDLGAVDAPPLLVEVIRCTAGFLLGEATE